MSQGCQAQQTNESIACIQCTTTSSTSEYLDNDHAEVSLNNEGA